MRRRKRNPEEEWQWDASSAAWIKNLRHGGFVRVSKLRSGKWEWQEVDRYGGYLSSGLHHDTPEMAKFSADSNLGRRARGNPSGASYRSVVANHPRTVEFRHLRSKPPGIYTAIHADGTAAGYRVGPNGGITRITKRLPARFNPSAKDVMRRYAYLSDAEMLRRLQVRGIYRPMLPPANAKPPKRKNPAPPHGPRRGDSVLIYVSGKPSIRKIQSVAGGPYARGEWLVRVANYGLLHVYWGESPGIYRDSRMR